MLAADSNLDAYKRISDFEILLRRVLRWELMSEMGGGWLICLQRNFDEIESRIAHEKKSGIYSENSSELSYLTLQELLNIIFRDFWRHKFDEILNYDRGIFSLVIKQVVPLRNKVAHFRFVDILDRQNYKIIFEIEEILRKYYSSDRFTAFYLSSDPAWVDDSIDPENIDLIKSILHAKNVSSLWDEYSRFDGIRTYNIHPGFGLYYDNIFIELHVDSLSPALDLAGWFKNNKFTVSIISVSQSKIRFFWPLSIGNHEIRRGFSALAKMISHSARQNNLIDPNNIVNSEYIAHLRPDKSICIAF